MNGKRLKEKRVGEKALKGRNKGKDVSNCITKVVQLLSSQATGKSKKYEALDSRDTGVIFLFCVALCLF